MTVTVSTAGMLDAIRARGLTQENMAHAIGVTVSTVNRWMNHHSVPSKLATQAIRSLYDHDPSDEPE